jgi:hypothetical protein
VGLNATFGDLDSLLREALDISTEAIQQSDAALDNVRIVDDIIDQVQVSSTPLLLALALSPSLSHPLALA